MNILQTKKITMSETNMQRLATVGFVALIVAGIALAIYTIRFVPAVVNGIGEAAVSFGSAFTSSPEPAPADNVPVSSPATIPTTTTPTTTTTAPQTVGNSSAPRSPVAGARQDSSYQVGGAGAQSSFLFGFPDLAVEITAVGYLSPTTNAFVASSSIPVGGRPAIAFVIKNIGTNATGPWRFDASIPTRNAFIFQSEVQQSLLPGDRIEYTLGFDQPRRGADQAITVIANFNRSVQESDLENNSDSVRVTLFGS